MKGFKNTTKMTHDAKHLSQGGACYAKGGKVSQAKVGKVMHEWGKGELHSGSKKGPEVKSQKQAVAIALSEGRKAAHKSHGGDVKPVGRDAMAGKAVGYPMKGGKYDAVGAPIAKARGGMLQGVEAMNTRQARQLVRNNPDLANRVARLGDLAQLRTDLGNQPGTSTPRRSSLVGMQPAAPSPMGMKKGGKTSC
jgi:hypothetical protein